MKRITHREIKRLLSARGVPEPPPGLADRIKAEIPEVLQVGGAGPRPEGVRGMPPRVPALRPLWLFAASLLVVIGAGFVAVRFFAPTSDLAREIALGGVVRIEDVVVTVPARSTVERQKVASGSVGQRADKGAREAAPPPSKALTGASSARAAGGLSEPGAPSQQGGALALTVSDGNEPLQGVTITATAPDAAAQKAHTVVSGKDGRAEIRSLPPGDYTLRAKREGFQERETTVRVAGGAEDRVAVTMKQETVAEEAAPADAVRGVASATAILPAPKAAAKETAKGSILVTVRDPEGIAVVGATVLLAFADRPDVGCGFRSTGSAGVAIFCCVAPGAYRVCAQSPGFTPAGADSVVVPPGGQPRVTLTMERAPEDAAEHAWTCPTPRPAGKR